MCIIHKMSRGASKSNDRIIPVEFFNDFVEGRDASQTHRSVYNLSVPIAAVELNVIYLLRMAEGNALWKGKFLYMAHPNRDGSYIRGTPVIYYHTLHEQNMQTTGGKVEIMISNHNPEDSPIYRGSGYPRLPMN